MEFLTPTALYALFFLPLLLIPYLIKGRPRRVVFSSLLLLRQLSSPSARPWGALRLPPIFFLQLLLLTLLILALGEPVFLAQPSKVAIIMDNSASMQAVEGQKSRFQSARDQARELLGDLPLGARVDLFVTVPRLGPVGKQGLARSEALALIGELKPYDLGRSAADYGEELSRLVRGKGYDRIYFLTDHPAKAERGSVKIVSVGQALDNLALTSLSLRRSSLLSSEIKATVEIHSFSRKEERVRLSLRGGGKVLANRVLNINPGRSLIASFEGLSSHPFYEAELEIKDGLALDNHRYAILPQTAGMRILAISPRPEAIYSLRSIPGVSVDVIAPQAYEKPRSERYDLEIFQYSAPASLPQNQALFVLPPKENPLVALGPTLSYPMVTAWSDPHPLTQYINFSLFRPVYARPLNPLNFGDPIVRVQQGSLVIASEQGGYRYLALGFDPFPYLGRENLPASILTLNFLQWFYSGIASYSAFTGEPLRLGRAEGAVVVNPKREKFPIRGPEALFSQTYFQGFYEIIRGGKGELRAINFQDPKESDLIHREAVHLTEEPAVSGSRSLLFALWPYLLLLAVVLLFAEWFVNPPVKPA
ncbi:MAG: VWA domain-containing protein [Deltaproteobacteria bacterium]|nr:VWA domain-containing protein [Deltaproteobacteria bacterium]